MGNDGDGVPFFAYLFCGLLPWMAFSEIVADGTSVFQSNKNLLIDRAASPTALILTNVLASLMLQVVLMVIVLFVFFVGGVELRWTLVLIPYYMICLGCLGFVIALMVSPFAARSTDIAQAVNSLLLVWFWASPIIWKVEILPAELMPVAWLNPFYYVIEGYRSIMLYGDVFQVSLSHHLSFWAMVLCLGLTGRLALTRSASNLREWLIR